MQLLGGAACTEGRVREEYQYGHQQIRLPQ
jgi:hypothetical protein